MYKPYIQSVIREIEKNIASGITVESTAKANHVSPMQLYRDFYNATGYSVKEYIRKRRLSKALSLLKTSDMTLAEIAYVCGYSSQQLFCRSVKHALHQTPLEYKHSNAYYCFPMFNGAEAGWQITVVTESIPETLRLRFCHSMLPGIEDRAIQAFITLMPDYGGRILGRNGQQNGGCFCYELDIEYNEELPEKLNESVFQDFVHIHAYTATFAKTTVRNTEAEINAAWDYLYASWLKASMFEQSEQSYFEEYIVKNGSIKRLVLYLPVCRRHIPSQITIAYYEDTQFLISRKSGKDAEKKASAAVISYLRSHCPERLRTFNSFFVTNRGNEYICGIQLDSELHIPAGSGLELLVSPGGDYAVLAGECCGDNKTYETVLLTWVMENGFEIDGDAFTVYDTSGGFESKNIIARSFIKLKNVKNRQYNGCTGM